MSFIESIALLALAPPPPPGTQQNPTAQLLNTLMMFVLMGVVFYFIMIRPQQKRNRELAEMMKAIKPGDRVTTSSGIVGTIVSVKDKTVAIRSADTKLEVLKSSVTEITEKASASATAES